MMPETSMEISKKTLESIVHSVFLPPKLPQEALSEEEAHEDGLALLDLVLKAAEAYGLASEDQEAISVMKIVSNTIAMAIEMRQGLSLSEEGIIHIISTMKAGDVLMFHIRAQNAGIIMRQTSTDMLFELFEVSPPSARVVGTEKRLLCSYPGVAIFVPLSHAQDPQFLAQLGAFLEIMDHEVFDDAMPKSSKAGNTVVEERDVADPLYITQWFRGLLLGLGQYAEVTQIYKSVADEVNWYDAELPWRRSPLWLVIRVTLQTTLDRERLQNRDFRIYKPFMAFLMAKILRQALHQTHFDGELLFVMNAKLARRFSKLGRDTKLGHDIPDFVSKEVANVVKLAREELDKRWQSIQRQDEDEHKLDWTPDDLNFRQDTKLRLRNSRDYLSNVLKSQSIATSPTPFIPALQPRIKHSINTSLLPAFTQTIKGDMSEKRLAVLDFENWISTALERWTDAQSTSDVTLEDCELRMAELYERLGEYITLAQHVYKKNSVDMSYMLLTALLIWVALDRLAVKICPMMKEYPPEVPVNLMEPLLLPRKSAMELLHGAETYVAERTRAAAATGLPSVFGGEVSARAFAVRYFQDSEEHKGLRRTIETKAKSAQAEHIAQLHIKNREHATLLARRARDHPTCDRYINYYGRSIHSRQCNRCNLQEQADRLTCDVYEWPLPAGDAECMQIVFELQPPQFFAIWRDATLQLLHNLCGDSVGASNNQPTETLQSYSALSKYQRCAKYRVTVASLTKSWTRAHYRERRVPAMPSDICVNHAPQWTLFDNERKKWVHGSPPNEYVTRQRTTLKLPKSSPYIGLQPYVDNTTHTSNMVLANQASCPATIKLHEFIAFGTLRAGHRLQWLNILREIISQALTLRNPAIRTLLVEAAWQAGPRDEDSFSRESHRELLDGHFVQTLLDVLKELLATVKDNWLELNTVQIIVDLALRMLSFTTECDLVKGLYRLLRTCRCVALSWITQLQSSNLSDGEKVKLQLRILQSAALCRTTYDVDTGHIPSLLCSDEDVETLVKCAVMVFDNTPPDDHNVDDELHRILSRDRRISHRLESRLSMLVVSDCQGIDQSIAQIWTSYNTGTDWEALLAPDDRWITTQTNQSEQRSSQIIHYNLLTGQLLIDGSPLSRLPTKYVEHASYKRIFENMVLDVVPSSMPSMAFDTRANVFGWQVSFGLRSDELIVRTARGATTFELVPHKKFDNDLPNSFVQDHVHWMDIQTGTIEMRPLTSRWTRSPANWRIKYSLAGDSFMFKETTRMLDVHSSSYTMISRMFEPLEAPNRIHIMLRDSEPHPRLHIILPRFQLEFFLNDSKQLECHHFTNMIIDPDQNVGALYGLKNRLVLRLNKAQSNSRSVLIPFGQVHFCRQDSDHISITIANADWQPQVRFCLYPIDPVLRRFAAPNSHRDFYFLAYLHAISSYCLPDPLTGNTGTEEALDMLQSAYAMSFRGSDSLTLKILNDVSEVSPERAFYPTHIKAMQQVQWSEGLPMLSQHDSFSMLVSRIMDHWQKLNAFQVDDNGKQSHPKMKTRCSPKILVQRALLRNAFFRNERYADIPLGTETWVSYRNERDCQSTDKTLMVNTVTKLVQRWPIDLTVHPGILTLLRERGIIQGSRANIDFHCDQQWFRHSQIDVLDLWLPLFEALRTTDDKYQVTFVLCAMLHAGIAIELVHTLLAFATVPEFRKELLNPPTMSSFDLAYGFEPQSSAILAILCRDNYRLPFENGNEQYTQQLQDKLLKRQAQLDDEIKDLTNYCLASWRQYRLSSGDLLVISPRNRHYQVLDAGEAVKDPEMLEMFRHCFNNTKLQQHVALVQSLLDDLLPDRSLPPSPEHFTHFSQASEVLVAGYYFIPAVIHDILDVAELPELLEPIPRISVSVRSAPSHTASTPALRQVTQMKSLFDPGPGVLQCSTFRERYMKDLLKSYGAFLLRPDADPCSLPVDMGQTVLRYRKECEHAMNKAFLNIEERLIPQLSSRLRSLKDAGIWPHITPRFLLRLISTNCPIAIPPAWKEAIARFGCLITYHQQADRLVNHFLRGEESEMIKELKNEGQGCWSFGTNPEWLLDWLLMEIDNNLMIRPLQADVANEMIFPPSGLNSVSQLNMGEGKSSVIVPLVSTALADGDKLVRVVVLKSLSAQMLGILARRLGGLSDRRIFYLPFSRALKPTPELIQQVKDIFDECKRVKGVLVVQPEHILSFRLMGLERLVGGQETNSTAEALIDTRNWLQEKARDILDESDEILSVRYQLIYTVGLQQSMDAHPTRWMLVEEVFDLVRERIKSLAKRFHQSIELAEDGSPNSFPHMRILQLDTGLELLRLLVVDICAGKLSIVSLRLFPEEMQRLASDFIQNKDMDSGEFYRFTDYCKSTGASYDLLVLLRGLIAHGVLLFALKEKRWRVEYGLDKTRTGLAVPYRAKDVPAARAEFGHPDVAIALTCLSYYFQGLTSTEIRLCFQHLFKSDNPAVLYETWVEGCNAPDSLRTLNGVNMDDPVQFSFILPLFHKNKRIIDFYLNSFVFPKEAKEFPHKLSASGWDLAEAKKHPITGFSGTNDNRYLLPLSTQQCDLERLLDTNARVISYLLQPENNHYRCAQNSYGQKISTKDLLDMIVDTSLDPPVHVLIDVGAQVLDLQNQEVAEGWLSKSSKDMEAAVYFDENDEVMVIGREGKKEPFAISPYSMRLEVCLIYLDEVHTRGTDFKLPTTTRAAVTLGPRLCKDKLVQACMRMRKLGFGQSLIFLAPPEVDLAIRHVNSEPDANIETIDIVRWSIEETCRTMEVDIKHWASQGLVYEVHQDAWEQYSLRSETEFTAQALQDVILEREAQTLEEMYGLGHRSFNPIGTEVRQRRRHIANIESRCTEFGVALDSLQENKVREEQERELAHEQEREQQIERPPKTEPHKHEVHRSVKSFVKSGKIPSTDMAFFVPAYQCLQELGIAKACNAEEWTQQLIVTKDYMRTVVRVFADNAGDFLRPVQWIVSSTRSGKHTLVIMSPYEINHLLPKIRSSSAVHLHIYSPKVTKSMRSLDDLCLHCTPPPLMDWRLPEDTRRQLNLFAGQLYLRNFEDYSRLCNFLGLFINSKETPVKRTIKFHSDGFIQPQYRLEQTTSPFSKSPIPFLKNHLATCQRGQDFSKTHVGKIVHAELLAEDDFRD